MKQICSNNFCIIEKYITGLLSRLYILEQIVDELEVQFFENRDFAESLERQLKKLNCKCSLEHLHKN